MLPAAKGGIALVVVASSVTGGYFLFNPGTKEKKHVSVLSSLHNLQSTYGSGKFGNTYSIYMVDPNNEKNEWWWKEVYADFKSFSEGSSNGGKLSEEFKNTTEKIKSAYSKTKAGEGSKALNQVCEVAFKDAKNNWGSKTNYEDNVWTYCSILRSHPKVIPSSDTTYDNQKGSSHKDKAVSVLDKDNEANKSFWDLRNKEFFGEVTSKSVGSSGQISIFKDLFKKDKKTRTANDNIKKACEDAYKLATSENDQATDVDIKKFCYLIPEIATAS
ncbi:hypothetical protein MHSWG343_04810 [Candidatus Mycoplasma haematohominis]|uniref:Uncharacterized protein n=1 Tax=Candidatus Mycoplasma haematohominis TaxID=1494318 RepID=A0A478FR66_9MOLU|nr:hypothetical protein MHSWG343_04810 [Candidatus Mycoplasma haemohominis]